MLHAMLNLGNCCTQVYIIVIIIALIRIKNDHFDYGPNREPEMLLSAGKLSSPDRVSVRGTLSLRRLPSRPKPSPVNPKPLNPHPLNPHPLNPLP